MFVLDLGGVYSRTCFLQALESTGKDFPNLVIKGLCTLLDISGNGRWEG